MAGWVVVLGAHPVIAQTPKSEESDAQPSVYTHPLRTWLQTQPHRNYGRVRNPRSTTNGIMGKLQSIIIPQIEFRQTTLGDAVEYLRQESRRLDPEPDPRKRGVNIICEFPTPAPPMNDPAVPGLPVESTPPPEATPQNLVNQNTRLWLTMTNLPLLDALKYLAKQVGLAVKVEAEAVYLGPPGSPRFMVTAEYRVPPELLGGEPDPRRLTPEDEDALDRAGVIRGTDVKGYFENSGVAFPYGASASYSWTNHRLIVRNTQENLDKIVSVISSALKTPPPTPVNP